MTSLMCVCVSLIEIIVFLEEREIAFFFVNKLLHSIPMAARRVGVQLVQNKHTHTHTAL